jgi:hypothetical protein
MLSHHEVGFELKNVISVPSTSAVKSASPSPFSNSIVLMFTA